MKASDGPSPLPWANQAGKPDIHTERMLLSENPKLLFVHIYKNAGTSIRRAFLKAGVVDESKDRGLHGHATAAEIARSIGEEAFRGYRSFAVVRNPWDWQVSLYRYTLDKPNHHQHEFVKGLGSFEAYLDWRCREEVRLQKSFLIGDDGTCLVNRLLRFETLAKDFGELCAELDMDLSLPHLNASQRSPWRDCYNERLFELVSETFAEDIAWLGYKDCSLH